MRYLHTMIRVTDLEKTLHFFETMLGMTETRRIDNEKGRFTLVFLASSTTWPAARPSRHPCRADLQLGSGGVQRRSQFRASGYEVDDIYALCHKLMDGGVVINRPPRDGHMAFVRTPDNISLELLQKGGPEHRPNLGSR